MILITTGSSGAPFDRLLRVIEQLDTAEDIVVQHGPSSVRPHGATCVSFMPFDELNELIERASAVITHGGVGSVLTTLMHGKRPLVVPRLRRFREVVDDHQLAFARRLAEADLVILVEEPSELPTIFAETSENRITLESEESALISDLSAYLHRHVPNGTDTARDAENAASPA